MTIIIHRYDLREEEKIYLTLTLQKLPLPGYWTEYSGISRVPPCTIWHCKPAPPGQHECALELSTNSQLKYLRVVLAAEVDFFTAEAEWGNTDAGEGEGLDLRDQQRGQGHECWSQHVARRPSGDWASQPASISDRSRGRAGRSLTDTNTDYIGIICVHTPECRSRSQYSSQNEIPAGYPLYQSPDTL